MKTGCFFEYMLSSLQKQFIREHENEDVSNLALRFSGELTPFVLAQIAGRQMAKYKIPTWYTNDAILYPPHISLEQASSEITARYKTEILSQSEGLLVDLTGGLGVDFSFMSPFFREGIYVEQNRDLCQIGKHNFDALNLRNITVKNDTSETFLQTPFHAALIYLDPSRRDDDGRKVFRIEDCTPHVVELKALLLQKSDRVMIKFSPMLDISLALKALANVSEVHIVSVDNECKELLFLLSGNVTDCFFHAVNLKKNGEKQRFSYSSQDEQMKQASYTSEIQTFLYEPNASLLKAGAFNLISDVYKINKLHKNSHLYTSDVLISDFPGRIFQVKNVFAPNKKNIKTLLSETKKANVAVRNFPMSVAEIRRKTSLKEGGDTYLFATTIFDERKVWIVCEKG